MERKKREERRRNVVIRGMEVKGKERMEEVLGNIGAKVEIEEVKRLGGKASKRRKVVWMRLKSEDQKREVMERKKKLKRREQRILDDCTWKERRMKWKFEEIARKKMRKGRRVRIGYGAIRIDDQWWKWDESEEVLFDRRGKVWQEDMGKGKGGREEVVK